MNELKLNDFVGQKHEWIIASHEDKRLYAAAFYYPTDKRSIDVAFRIVLNGENYVYASTLTEAISVYNGL